MEFRSCARGRQWCGIIHYLWWTASIKPRLLFSRACFPRAFPFISLILLGRESMKWSLRVCVFSHSHDSKQWQRSCQSALAIRHLLTTFHFSLLPTTICNAWLISCTRFVSTRNVYVNVDKSRITVFTKRRTKPSACKLHSGQVIKQADAFVYLGILYGFEHFVFYGGTRRSCAENKSAAPSWPRLQSCCSFCSLCYGSELWSNMTTTDLNIISRFQH